MQKNFTANVLITKVDLLIMSIIIDNFWLVKVFHLLTVILNIEKMGRCEEQKRESWAGWIAGGEYR
jgi:hypothetical protein